jgi:hypothetical protein
MSALVLAQTTILTKVDPMFLETLMKKFSGKEWTMEDVYSDTDLQKFLGGGKKKRGPKKSPLSSKTPKERAMEPPNKDNCQARTWHNGYGPQCLRSKTQDGCFCKMHQGKLVDGKWWLGLITEPRPDDPSDPSVFSRSNIHSWRITTDGKEIGKKEKKSHIRDLQALLAAAEKKEEDNEKSSPKKKVGRPKATGPKLVKTLTKESREALRQDPDSALTEEPEL